MPANRYTPDQAAQLIGASPSTVRNWCKQHADALSHGCNPPAGSQRRLTEQDVAILQQIAAMRAAGQSVEDIRIALASAKQTGHLTIDATPTTVQEAAGPTETATAMLQVTVATLDRIAARMANQEDSSIRQVHREVAALRVLVWILASIVLVLAVGMVALWVLR
jgi:DNA-binding transcriptional MerR regulator